MSYNIDENGFIYCDLDNNVYAPDGDWMRLDQEFHDSPAGSSSSGSAESPYDGSSELSSEPESEVSTTISTISTTSSTTTSRNVRKRARGCRRKSDDEVDNLDNTKRCRNSRQQRNEEVEQDKKELERVMKENKELQERIDNTEYWLNEAARLFMEMHELEPAYYNEILKTTEDNFK